MLRREPQALSAVRSQRLDGSGSLSQRECETSIENPGEKSREYSSKLVKHGGLDDFYKQSALDTEEGGGAWCAAVNQLGEWMEVDLRKAYKVKGTIIQGALGPDAWVTEYKVAYSIDRETWHHDGDTFAGNKDFHTHVKNDFKRPERARFVRFFPRKWHTSLCMRAAVEICSDSEMDPVEASQKASNISKADEQEDPFKQLEANASEHNGQHEAEESTSAIDCVWGEWDSWSLCTTSCGEAGVRRREREVQIYPQNHGRNCEGEHHEDEDCNRVHCPLGEPHEEGEHEQRHHSTIVVVPVPAPVPVPVQPPAVEHEHDRVVVMPKPEPVPVPVPAPATAPSVQAVVVPVALPASTTLPPPPEPLPLPVLPKEVEDGPREARR